MEPPEEAAKREILRRANRRKIVADLIEALCRFVELFENAIERPAFVDADTPQARFVFENPSPQILQVLKSVRAASGLRACLVLLGAAHTTEVGVLLRTIDDCLADILFVDELLEKGYDNVTEAQRQFVDNYFVDDGRTLAEKLDDSVKKGRINHNERRQKVQAAEARVIGASDPHRIKKIVSTIDGTYSGIVHADYSSVMDMYGGATPHFHTRGIPARLESHWHHLALVTHHALNMFCSVAFRLGLGNLAEEIRELRRVFETSEAYTYRSP